MKRKKFVKQLMALGMTRNQANAMAYCCRVTGRTYEADYQKRAPWLRMRYETHKLSVSLRMTAGYLCSGLARAAAAVEKLRDSLVVHHVQPISPENLGSGKMVIVTRQEHDRLHGYSANVSFADELETAGGGQG